MATVISPIRKKRNFKALQLNVKSTPASPAESQAESVQPIPVRQAPVPGGKKRPPPMTLKPTKVPSSGAAAVSAIEQETPHLLTVASNGPSSAPNTASASTRRNTYHATLSSTLANLDMNTEIKFDLRNEDLKDLQELGQGNGGSVKKVEHTPTGTIMAKKVFIYPLCVGLSSHFGCATDCADRCKTICTKTNSSRAADHARLQFQVYHFILGRLYSRPKYLYLHGIHG